ncbi:hypothetical protein KFQ06_20675 [Serratia entomophila]|uniref:Uncharacterized protein n=1 Tax=Serratia entomophila TaxID=42906 RepID=A0ABY5CSB9_9GAMM|nr:hypothetical protein [Serratia entomophila]USV00410.1 hypothetical protein KFQ06_20675 [Serratia entomophila]CAI1615006.1 Uncharacterised protein [Serratia entomophila]
MDNGSITFFDIKACGFYRLKKKADELEYKSGGIIQVMDDLEEWLKDKSFEQTLPWKKEEQPLRTRVYSRGLARDLETNDAVIVLYREVGNGNGIHGIKVDSKVGGDSKGTIKAGNEGGKDKIIWGEPCYYWVIPEINKVASIRFPHSYADTYLFCNYFAQHVNNNSKLGDRKKSKRTIEAKNTPGRMVDIYSTTFQHTIDGKGVNCIFKFITEETKLKAVKENLAKIRHKITHTFIRDVTCSNQEDPRQPILILTSNVLASLVGAEKRDQIIGAPPILKQPKKIEVKIDGAPSDEELQDLFAMRAVDSDWDVGFKLSDNDTPVWLSSYVARTRLPLHDSDGSEHYSANFLLDEIKKIRADLIREVKAAEVVDHVDVDDNPQAKVKEG